MPNQVIFKSLPENCFGIAHYRQGVGYIYTLENSLREPRYQWMIRHVIQHLRDLSDRIRQENDYWKLERFDLPTGPFEDDPKETRYWDAVMLLEPLLALPAPEENSFITFDITTGPSRNYRLIQ